MPPYHSISGSEITVYLDVKTDPAENFTLGIPFEKLLEKIAIKWGTITNTMNFRLIIAPAESPGMDESYPSPPGTALFENATPSDRIIYHNDVLVPPSGVEFFKLKVGLKDSVRPETQSARISYVDYPHGTGSSSGYIYSQAHFPVIDLQDIGHELGHILGLVDRYYDAITWDSTKAIDRSCLQIRSNDWFVYDNVVQQNVDQRVPIDDNKPETKNLPRWAERASLLMHKNAMPKDKDDNLLDPDYDPSDNLMSSSSPTITAYQLGLIGIKNGQAQTPTIEPEIRTSNWVAILGDVSNPQYKSFYTWDGGQGLVFYPDNDATKPSQSYPCWNGSERGLDSKNNPVRPDLIDDARGKSEQFIRTFLGKHYDVSHRLIQINLRSKMCYCKRLLQDLK